MKTLIEYSKIPDYLHIAEKPIKLGGISKKISINEIKEKFDFQYTENILIPDELNYEVSAKDYEDKGIGKEINENEILERLNSPLNDNLTLCFIDQEVGYGVFAKELIKAGTIIAIYAGQIEKAVGNQNKIYGFRLNSEFRINAEKIGGIARFFQHLPYSPETVAQAIKDKASNLDSLIEIFQVHRVVFDKQEIEEIRQIYLSDKEKFRINVVEHNIYMLNNSREATRFEIEKSQDFLKEIKNLAVANINPIPCSFNNKLITVFRTSLDIQPGEQLGFSYGLEYWNTKNQSPRYFYKNGSIVPKEKFKINLSKTIKTEEKEKKEIFSEDIQSLLSHQVFDNDTKQLFKGIFNQDNKKHEAIKQKIKKDYNLPNTSRESLEKGLRMAACNNKEKDISLFIEELKVNVDAQDNKGKKTALHHAVIKGNLTCIKKLRNFNAHFDIPDSLGKTAWHYAEEKNITEIFKEFSRIAPK